MQTYDVILRSESSQSFRCLKAANGVDIDIEKKLTHHLHIKTDLETPYNVGLIVGASPAVRQRWPARRSARTSCATSST